MKQHIALARLAAALAVGAACGGPIVARPGMQTPAKSRTPAPGNNWPVSPAEAEQLLGKAPLSFRQLKATDKGVAGAMKGAVTFPGRRGGLEVKWKPLAPGHLDGWNNSPRKEVAAYEIQKWFLQPADYVVPTTVVRCIPLSEYRRVRAKAQPTVAGTRCVLGTPALWLEDVDVPKESSTPPASRGSDYATTSPTSMSSPSWCSTAMAGPATSWSRRTTRTCASSRSTTASASAAWSTTSWSRTGT